MDQLTYAYSYSCEGKIDELCLELFNHFCDRRRVVPLAFLMTHWPIMEVSPISVWRIAETMNELRTWHTELLTEDEKRLIGDLIDLAAGDEAYD
ncbi:hypothetical protein [Paraburkholderia caledonica]|uniref:Uncharacterized protein n=1 Tax=Paraburkholderia caledonica TaxID=134536 RepID=A0ABU1KYZ8_9BURK|nr:hypothetical protein [Paraburkholderia caledonica]MDR6376149.1 hypothetical protein [Paraburkholderia caledonica]